VALIILGRSRMASAEDRSHGAHGAPSTGRTDEPAAA
jgi:hypothetical protein